MAKRGLDLGVTPGEAKWILARLIKANGISVDDVRLALADLRAEIEQIEGRLSDLRGPSIETQVKPTVSAPVPPAEVIKKVGRRAKKKGHVRGIAGTLLVLLRSIPEAEHAGIAEIRTKKGLRAAVEAAKKKLGA